MTMAFGGGEELERLFVKLGLDASDFRAGIQQSLNDFDRMGRQLEQRGRALTQIGQSLTLGLTAPIVAIGGGAIKAAVDFESAFAGVRKTVDATEAQFAELEQGILDMSKQMPAAAGEIAGVTEAAGQLGIQTQHLLEFTETMIQLGETTNLASREGATQLARFANITGMAQEDFDRLGSAVVELGNKFATTEAEIVSLGLRIAGAGNIIGLTEAEILGFATAMSSLGINVEAGGTAISRVMLNIFSAVQQGSEELKFFAAVSGQTVEQFSRSFREDAAGAIVDFIGGLGTIQDAGGDVISVLEAVGLNEIRVRDALLRSAGASDLLTEAIDSSSRAYAENTALQEEFDKRNQTATARLEKFWNRVVVAAITLGDALLPALNDTVDAALPLIDAAETLAEAFASLPRPVQTTVVATAAFLAALGPLTFVTGTVLTSLGALIRLLGLVTVSFTTATVSARGFAASLAGLGTLGAVIAGGNIGDALDKAITGRDINDDRFGPDLGPLNFLRPPKAIGRLLGFGGGGGSGEQEEDKSLLDLHDQLAAVEEAAKKAGEQVEEGAFDLDGLNDALGQFQEEAGGAAQVIDVLGDGLISMEEAAMKGFSAAEAGAIEAVDAIVRAQDEAARKAFDFEKMLSRVAFAFQESTRAAERMVLTLAREALERANAAAAALFGRPTQEVAALEVQLAQRRAQLLRVSQPGREPTRAEEQIQEEIDAIQHRIALLRAESAIQEKQIQAADATLLSQNEQRNKAEEVAEEMGDASREARTLSQSLGVDIVPQMDALREAAERLDGATRVLSDDAFRQSLIPTVVGPDGVVETFDAAAARAQLLAEAQQGLEGSTNDLQKVWEELMKILKGVGEETEEAFNGINEQVNRAKEIFGMEVEGLERLDLIQPELEAPENVQRFRAERGFQTGTPFVPFDMTAFVHRGEMIIPADVARTMRNSGMGGGQVNNFNGDIILPNVQDVESFKRELREWMHEESLRDAQAIGFSVP